MKPSKGKKAAKKERNTKESNPLTTEIHHAPQPPAPDLLQHVDVGLNSITRNLGTQSPGPLCEDDSHGRGKKYSMVFVARGDQSSTFNCHFPTMVGAASRDLPPDDKIRLVGFSKPCSERLSNCLKVARVSSIAIEREAPGAGALWEVVKRSVKPVDVRWLDGDRVPPYLSTKINAIETTSGPKRPKQS